MKAIPVARGNTIAERFLDSVRLFADRPAVRSRGADGAFHDLDYRTLGERVFDLAAGLRARGLVRGDRLALWLESSPEWIFVDLATNLLGAATTTIYHSLPPGQAAAILEDSAAKMLITRRALAQSLGSERAGLAELQSIFTTDEASESAAGQSREMSLAELMALGAEQRRQKPELDQELRKPTAQPDDLSALIYTSGTTGEPKGAMLDNRGLCANSEMVLNNFYARATQPSMLEGETTMLHLPLAHVMGRNISLLITLFVGGTVAIADPEREKLPKNILELRPHGFVTVPYLLDKIMLKVHETVAARGPTAVKMFRRAIALGLKSYRRELSLFERLEHALLDRMVLKKIRARLGGRVRIIIIGGANPNQESVDFFCSLGIFVCEGYGSTEITTAAFTRLGATRGGTSVAPGVEGLKFADDGEILVRGPNLMKGYWRKPEATREAIDAEGYWHTGDIGQLDEHGLMHIVDRKKEIFVCSTGKNVAPQAVENALKRSFLFANACALGDKEKYISVLLVLDAPAFAAKLAASGLDRTALIEQELKACCGELAGFEQPKRWAVVDEPFSLENGLLTPTLKLKRKAIRERHAALIESLYDRATQRTA